MYVYIIMLIISLVLSCVSVKVKNKKLKITFQILSTLPFFLVSAIRYDVGTDYMYRYKADFEYIKNGGIPPNLEFGYMLIVKLCLLISENSQLLFIFTSALIIFTIFFTIYKYSRKPMLSIFIFFAGCFFFQSMNVLRQYISASIILIAYEFLIEKKYNFFIPCVILAFFIHSTSIIAIVSLLLTRKLTGKPKIVLVITLVIIVFSGIFSNMIDYIFSFTRFSVYIDSTFAKSDIKYIALVVNSVVYLMCYYITTKKKEINRRDIVYINIMGLSVICVTLGNVYSLFNRASYYFSIIQILAIPYFIDVAMQDFNENILSIGFKRENIKAKINNIIGKLPILKNKNVHVNNAIILTTMIILIFSANICYTNVLHNDDEVIPYKTIFDVE